MITRHFYRLDEVEASLLWCLIHRRTEESLFWCLELVDSGLGIYAFQLLWKAWIYFVGTGSLAWFQQALLIWRSDEIQEPDILLLCFQLATLPSENRDCSPFCLVLMGLQDYTVPANHITGQLQNLSVVQKAIQQRKLELAWQICKLQWTPEDYLAILSQPEHKEIFTNILTLQEILELPENLQWITRALSICFVSLTFSKKELAHSKKPLQAELSSLLLTKLSEWKDLLGKRKRRYYPILIDSLSWITQRGRQTYKKTTLAELREIWKHIDSSVPCWENKDFDIESDGYEDLMDETFPDDIPDEWSAADQQKSHGPGVLQLKETPSYTKFLKKWLRVQSCRLVWNGIQKALDISENIKGPFSEFDPGFLSLYEKRSVTLLPILLSLKPKIIHLLSV